MFGIGKILSKATKIATLPLDIAESCIDVASGGDGSKRSKKESSFPWPTEMRDAACDAMEDIDD